MRSTIIIVALACLNGCAAFWPAAKKACEIEDYVHAGCEYVLVNVPGPDGKPLQVKVPRSQLEQALAGMPAVSAARAAAAKDGGVP